MGVKYDLTKNSAGGFVVIVSVLYNCNSCNYVTIFIAYSNIKYEQFIVKMPEVTFTLKLLFYSSKKCFNFNPEWCFGSRKFTVSFTTTHI